jgi:hypothetical protein
MKRPRHFYSQELYLDNIEELFEAVGTLMDTVEELQEKVEKLEREKNPISLRKE